MSTHVLHHHLETDASLHRHIDLGLWIMAGLGLLAGIALFWLYTFA